MVRFYIYVCHVVRRADFPVSHQIILTCRSGIFLKIQSTYFQFSVMNHDSFLNFYKDMKIRSLLRSYIRNHENLISDQSQIKDH